MYKEINMTTCIVTMFFDLRRYLDSNMATRDIDFYMKNGKKTLEVSQPMVIFCDGTMRGYIEAIRGDRPTLYVERSLEDYDYIKMLLPLVVKNRENSSVYNQPTQRNTPMYFLCTVFKFTALYIAKQLYKADTYMWLDFGGSHVLRNLESSVESICKNPRPKIGCCYIHYRSSHELYPMRKFLEYGGPCSVANTSFTVSCDYVDRLYTKSMSILYEQITQCVGHTDEQVLVYVYNQHPEWFSLYYGDYYSVLTNYHRTIEDMESVRRFFIQNAQRDNQHHLVEDALESIRLGSS